MVLLQKSVLDGTLIEQIEKNFYSASYIADTIGLGYTTIISLNKKGVIKADIELQKTNGKSLYYSSKKLYELRLYYEFIKSEKNETGARSSSVEFVKARENLSRLTNEKLTFADNLVFCRNGFLYVNLKPYIFRISHLPENCLGAVVDQREIPVTDGELIVMNEAWKSFFANEEQIDLLNQIKKLEDFEAKNKAEKKED